MVTIEDIILNRVKLELEVSRYAAQLRPQKYHTPTPIGEDPLFNVGFIVNHKPLSVVTTLSDV